MISTISSQKKEDEGRKVFRCAGISSIICKGVDLADEKRNEKTLFFLLSQTHSLFLLSLELCTTTISFPTFQFPNLDFSFRSFPPSRRLWNVQQHLGSRQECLTFFSPSFYVQFSASFMVFLCHIRLLTRELMLSIPIEKFFSILSKYIYISITFVKHLSDC